MSDQIIRPDYFECVCYSNEHTLKFEIDEEENVLYTSVFLNHYHNVFKRAWVAVKYVLGYKSVYGHWDCWILRSDDVSRLKQTLNKIREDS